VLKYVADEQSLIDLKNTNEEETSYLKTYVYVNINLYLQYTKQRLRNSPLRSLILCNRYSMFSLYSLHLVLQRQCMRVKKAHIPENTNMLCAMKKEGC
jgi:hypothetical protein